MLQHSFSVPRDQGKTLNWMESSPDLWIGLRLRKMCSCDLWSIKMDPGCAYTENMICPSAILEPDNLLGVLSMCPWALLSSGYDSIGSWRGGKGPGWGQRANANHQKGWNLEHLCVLFSFLLSGEARKITSTIQSQLLAVTFIASQRWMEQLTQALVKDSSHRSWFACLKCTEPRSLGSDVVLHSKTWESRKRNKIFKQILKWEWVSKTVLRILVTPTAFT